MGMPDDHEVRFGIDARQRRRVVFGPHARGVVARFAEAAVDQDDLHVGALALQAGERRRGGVSDAPHADLAAELSAIPQHRARCRESGDPDLHGTARQHDGLGEQRPTGAVFDIGGDVPVRRFVGGAAQERHPEVEIVIPRCHDVVLERVERVDDGLWLAFVVAAVECRERISLQEIAGVHQDQIAGIARAQRFQCGGGAREPAGRRGIAHVVPAEHATVNVRRRDDDDVRGIGSGRASRLRGGLERQEYRQETHSAFKIAERALAALPSRLLMANETGASTPHRILVVDDEPDITALVAYHLAKEGYRVTTAGTGADALRSAREERPDLVVLDLMLPGHSGFEVLAELRRRDETRDVGVLLLTARKDEPDRIKGLSLGADDYLAKPFSPKELVLRVGAILRRLAAPPVSAGGRLVGGPIVLDRTAHRVTVAGEETELTATEFKLLERLIERRDRVQSRSQLLESVWQAQPDIQTRTVDMHVQRLRAKLGAAGDWIETVRAVGYRFREPAPPPAARRRRT